MKMNTVRQVKNIARIKAAQRGVPTLRNSRYRRDDFESGGVFMRWLRKLWRM